MFWTYHVQMRLKGRTLSREALLRSVESYEILEAYADDKYLPSYLVYSDSQEGVAHIHVAADIVEDNIRIVTAYRSNPHEWEPGFRRRRTHQ